MPRQRSVDLAIATLMGLIYSANVPRTLVALVRHGHYEQPPGVPSAHLPHPLTDRGRQEAAQLASTLLDFAAKLDLAVVPTIHASSLLRAHETAQILVADLERATGGPFVLQSSDALAERSLGAAANLTVAQIEAVIARDPRFAGLEVGWKSSRHIRLPFIGAESLAQAGARVASYIQRALVDRLTADERGTLTIFVGHGAALRHAAHEFGVLNSVQVRQWSMHYAAPVYLERHSWDEWSHCGGQWRERELVSRTGGD